MAIDLSDEQFIDSLRREVTPLGTTLFATVDEDTWLGYLTDAFWEARLDGFMIGYSADEEGIIEPVNGVELGRQWVALIILYAGIKVLRNRILNTKTGFRAKAGPVEYEEQQSATMLAEMLKQLAETKKRILDELEEQSWATTVGYFDAYTARVCAAWHPYELL